MSQFYAILVGITEYKSILRCNGSYDAAKLYGVLTDPNYCNYPNSNVRLILDSQATEENIQKSIKETLSHMEANDTLLIYLSGHATRKDDIYYFIPTDGQIVDIESTSIRNTRFHSYFKEIPSTNICIIIDSAHSGGIADNIELNNDNYIIISSSTNHELSWNFYREPQSMFTHYLIEGLRGGVKDKDGSIHVMDLYQYVNKKVVDESRKMFSTASDSRQQTPVLIGRFLDNFAITPKHTESSNYKLLETNTDIEHQLELMNEYKKYLYVLQIQAARLGGSFTPPHIQLEIDDVSKKISEIKVALEKH